MASLSCEPLIRTIPHLRQFDLPVLSTYTDIYAAIERKCQLHSSLAEEREEGNLRGRESNPWQPSP
jgi:hypothetical protein